MSVNIIHADFSDYFALPNQNLRNMFRRIEHGSDAHYRTNFYGASTPTSVVLESWKKHLKSLQSDMPGLYDFEMDLASKVGPMSIMKPLEERRDDIASYYDSILLESEPLTNSAIAATLREWSRATGTRPRNQLATWDKMKKSTNSGSPYYKTKRDVWMETIPCQVEVQHEGNQFSVIQRLPNDTYKSCAILGWRGQEGGADPDSTKQRVVWMFPFAVNVCELQVYQPLIEAAQRFNINPAWVSMDDVDERITKLFDTKSKNDLIICTDFEKFDQHFNPTLQSAAGYMLSRILNKDSESLRWLDQVFPIKYVIPLAAEWDKLYVGAHGMGSGSGGTNFDETLVHKALQYESAQRMGQQLNPNSMCLGDDGILSYPGITAKDVTDSYTKHGLSMNPDKQSESKTECTYLRRWHSIDYRIGGICVGVYSTCRAVGRLCEQERFYDPRKWSANMVALRQLSILENCKYHPLREQFAEWCMKGDKYRLGIDIPGFLSNISSIAEEAEHYMPDFLGYTKSLGSTKADAGIENWWIVQFLKDRS